MTFLEENWEKYMEEKSWTEEFKENFVNLETIKYYVYRWDKIFQDGKDINVTLGAEILRIVGHQKKSFQKCVKSYLDVISKLVLQQQNKPSPKMNTTWVEANWHKYMTNANQLEEFKSNFVNLESVQYYVYRRGKISLEKKDECAKSIKDSKTLVDFDQCINLILGAEIMLTIGQQTQELIQCVQTYVGAIWKLILLQNQKLNQKLNQKNQKPERDLIYPIYDFPPDMIETPPDMIETPPASEPTLSGKPPPEPTPSSKSTPPACFC